MARALISETIGSKLTLKTTFFTKKLLATMLLVPFDKPSAKKNHGNMPVISHKMKGKSSTGCAFKAHLEYKPKDQYGDGWLYKRPNHTEHIA